jgi:predicted flap endonuclease-1-like 5' DNA nuclease
VPLISPIAGIGPAVNDLGGAGIERFRRLNQWTDLLHQRRRHGERQPKQPDDE